MSDDTRYFLHPRNAIVFLFAVIAFALVVAPSISTSLMGTAAATALAAKATTTTSTTASVPHLMIQKDTLGPGSNTNPGGASDGSDNSTNNNNSTETTPPTNPSTPGEKHFLIIGSSREFSLTVSAQGKLTNTDVSVDGTINGIAELNPDNSIVRIAKDSLSGSLTVTDSGGNTLATLDLRPLDITVKGTKVTVTSDYTDQDNDRGRFTASFYASSQIIAPDVGNSDSIDLSNDNNKLSIVYNTANQRVTAADGNVAATLDFPA